MSYPSYPCHPWRIRSVIGVASAICATLSTWSLVPRQAHACHEVQLHIEIEPDFVDQPTGTLLPWYGYSPWPASGARVKIIRPYPETPLGMYLDDEGRATFESQFHAGFKILVYPEAVLGPGKNIRIKVLDVDATESQPEMVVADALINENHMIHAVIPTAPVWSIMAGATAVLHRLSTAPELGTSPLTDDHELIVRRTGGQTSYALFDFTAGESAHTHKFVIGHEIGHWVQGQTVRMLGGNDTVINWPRDYSYVPMDDPCKFMPPEGADVTLYYHGIRSAEHSSGAMPEGFGHFAASVAFNEVDIDDFGIFRYYKNLDNEDQFPGYEDLADNNYLIHLMGGEPESDPWGGPSAWVENQCDGDWDWTPGQEVTSEIDWMRFFWLLVTADEQEFGTAMTFWDVVHLVAYTQTNHRWDYTGGLYGNLVETVCEEQSSFMDRFTDLTAVNGVYNGPAATCEP